MAPQYPRDPVGRARSSLCPKVSLCVPSRNRQHYFQQTIQALVANMRLDVEFVFADNSTDPSIMNAFMVDVVADPRVLYLPSQDRVLPMNDNWERCIEASSGDWVIFIGDDDYIDLNVVDVIDRIITESGPADVVSWSRLNYNWPGNRPHRSNVAISLGDRVAQVDRDDLIRRNFLWENCNVVPECPFCFYHGAVSRETLEKIKRRFGGRYCEHITVDFENTAKVLMVGSKFYFVERPFSVLGSCPASNSASIGTAEEAKKAHAAAMLEVGRNIDHDPCMANFPFPVILGVSAAVAQVQQWFKFTYKYKFQGWEKEFARACAGNCNMSRSQEVYDVVYERYHKAFSAWHGGIYLKYFLHPAPIFGLRILEPFTGVNENQLYINEDMCGAATPQEIYELANQVLKPVDQLSYQLFEGRLKLARSAN